ncbi:uncharacterized protein LOC128678355 [Plodia interpunctella]|uniref:uncharacterized protein LOC128678355 n=1 Tax=Plodia interpunctella TaxID=58824 RepID=UPI0023685582|nr:uncharacterized protein LOC128678355 [Plodia interpunctella]
MRSVLVCCVILTITISASCFTRKSHPIKATQIRCNKKLMKRDAVVLLDTPPLDIDPVYKIHPIIAFRRLSRSRLTPRPIQSPRVHKSTKKYRKPIKPNHTPNKAYRKRVKSKYYRKRVLAKNKNYPPKHIPHYSIYQSEGFGEPPSDLKSYSKNQAYETRQKPYKEVTDSYGEPIKSSNIDHYPPIQHNQFHKEPDLRPGVGSWQEYEQPNDNAYAFSKKFPEQKKPGTFEIPDIDDEEDMKLDNSYYYYWLQDKPSFNMEQSKLVRMPWKVTKRIREDDDLLVGGQYAEPPGRYVPKFQPSAPMIDNDDDFSPPRRVNPDAAQSATISPYVNYKHSNMAFSPQNLNDAFSIVEK